MQKCKRCGSVVRYAAENGCKYCINEFTCNSCNKKFPRNQESKEYKGNCLVCSNLLKSSDRMGETVIKVIRKNEGIEVKVPTDNQVVRVIKKGNSNDVTSIQTQ